MWRCFLREGTHDVALLVMSKQAHKTTAKHSCLSLLPTLSDAQLLMYFLCTSMKKKNNFLALLLHCSRDKAIQ